MTHDDPIAKLARQIDAAKKTEHLAADAEHVAALLRRGACEMHAICAEFVSSVNSKLSEAALDLSPPAYNPEMFRESGMNLIRIGSQGRELQITFQATPQLVSTEKFLIPYVLEGEVRTYNQKMLEHFEIRSHAVFLCLEQDSTSWRYFDWRTRGTGAVDRELLVKLMGRLF
jgi:hypothetical protein